MASDTQMKDPVSGKVYDLSPLFKMLGEEFDGDFRRMAEVIDTVQATLIKHLPSDPDRGIGREFANAHDSLQQIKIMARKLGKQDLL